MRVIDPTGGRPLSLQEAVSAQSYSLAQAGFYDVRLANGRRDLVAVNSDRRESDLAPIPEETLALWRGGNPGGAGGGRCERGRDGNACGRDYRAWDGNVSGRDYRGWDFCVAGSNATQFVVVRYVVRAGCCPRGVRARQPISGHSSGRAMSAIEELRSYLEQLRRRFRLGAVVRGTAIVAAVALVATVLLTVIISRFAFSQGSLWSARAVLLVSLTLAATFGVALPLWRLGRRWWVRAEHSFPQFEQRLLTFSERDRTSGGDPFLELLAADTLRIARTADVETVAPNNVLIALLAVGVVSLGDPHLVDSGRRSRLPWVWRCCVVDWGRARLPSTRSMSVLGDATVRRHADQLVTAAIPGLQTGLRIHVRYQSAAKWEETTMLPQPGAGGSQFLFAGIPEDIEYYVEAGPVQSSHFHLRVADIPSVKQIRVTYQHPDWMHMADSVEEHGGDLRAVEGTEAQLEIVTDRPLSDGVLALDDGRQLMLTGGAGNVYRGSIKVEKDGSYHVAARDKQQLLRISEDYFIDAAAVKPPQVAVVRPERDYRASPIEEVTLQARADDPFGLSEFELHYSVNGGPEKTVNLMKPSRSGGPMTRASGGALLNLESLKLAPGDVVGFYAVAKDARSEAHTDISFIQIDPFERGVLAISTVGRRRCGWRSRGQPGADRRAGRRRSSRPPGRRPV